MATKKELSPVHNFIVDTFLFGEDRGLSHTESLLGKGVIDSSGILELVEFLENNYKIRIKDEDITPNNLDSIAKIGEFVGRKLSL